MMMPICLGLTLIWMKIGLEESPPLWPMNLVFSKKGYLKSLILYLRKVLHRDVGMKGLLYFLASEYGPATSRPHYHMLMLGLVTARRKSRYMVMNVFMVTMLR